MPENSLLLSRADSAVMSRDYALAARLYTTLLKDSPDDKELLKRLGNVFIKSGDDKKALPIYEKLQSLEPGNSEFLLALGGIYRRVEQYDKSVEVLNKALEAGGNDVQVYYNLGFTYKFQEKFEDAIDCFETVVALNPNDVLAYNHMGSIYELKKEYDSAIQAYQMGLKADPNHPILRFNLAKTYEESGNVDGAIREYEAALRYKPGWKEAYLEYSRLLFKCGRLKEAEALAEQAIKVNEDSARLQSLMGDIYMEEDYYEGAEERYNKSLKADPKRLKALLGLARSLEAQGKNSEALDAIKKAKEIAPDDDRVSKNSAAIHLSAKKLSAANKEIKALFEKDHDDLETLDLAAQYYICADDEKNAQAVYKRIERSDPSYKAHLSNASKRYRQKGDLQKAQSYIKKFLAESPAKNSKAYVALAQIEEGLGNLSEALAAYNKALEAGGENKAAKKSSARIARSIGSERAAPAESSVQEEAGDLNAGFDETESIQIDMGREEPAAPEAAEEKNDGALEDDFDFDAFGKSPLLDEEGDVDFGALAGIAESEALEDETALDMGLLQDEDGLKEKIEEEELPDEIPLESPASAEEELEEPEAVPAEEAQESADGGQDGAAGFADGSAKNPSAQESAIEEARADEAPAARDVGLEQKLEERKKALEDEYNKKLSSLQAAGDDLLEKMARVEDNAKKASEAAEKAWYAAQMAADNAQAAEHSQEALNERMEKIAEEAAKKAEEPEDEGGDGFDDLFDDILGTTVEGEEDEESGGEEGDESRFADDELFDEPAAEDEREAPSAEEEPPAEEEAAPRADEAEPLPEPAGAEKTESAAPIGGAVTAQALIPAIENILRQENSARDYSSEIGMFKALRGLSDALPPQEKRGFMQSRTRVSLDYLISRLEGRPGLLKTSAALRKSGELLDYVREEDVKSDYPLEELAKIVLSDMKELSGGLAEDDLAAALEALADSALN